ncbi:unnamed protein product [Ixodes pacificus]
MSTSSVSRQFRFHSLAKIVPLADRHEEINKCGWSFRIGRQLAPPSR